MVRVCERLGFTKDLNSFAILASSAHFILISPIGMWMSRLVFALKDGRSLSYSFSISQNSGAWDVFLVGWGDLRLGITMVMTKSL